MTRARETVAVLGANGFVGREVVMALAAAGLNVRAVVRRGARHALPEDVLHELGAGGWRAALEGCDQVVHLIARTHRLHESPGPEQEEAYRAVNLGLTAEVLAAAEAAGVRRLVYMSSVKAMGESRATPYVEEDEPRPLDAYGRTKLEAEQLVCASSLEAVVLRPPLVYGPGVGGNVGRLLRAVRRGVPLPLGRATAPRSMIAVSNLSDAVRAVLVAEALPHDLYLVADDVPLSARALVEGLAAGLDRGARLVPVPVPALRAAGALARRQDEVDRLVSPLVLDPSRLRRSLGWSPPVSPGAALAATARAGST